MIRVRAGFGQLRSAWWYAGVLGGWLFLSQRGAAEPFCNFDALPSFQHYGVARELSQVGARAILQDSTGFLWAGTEEGLDRFDGYRFAVWRRQHDIAALPNDHEALAVQPGTEGESSQSHTIDSGFAVDRADGVGMATPDGLYLQTRSGKQRQRRFKQYMPLDRNTLAPAAIPAWWERPFARVSCATVCVLVFIAAYLARTYHLKRLNVWLERAVAERTRQTSALQDERSRLFMNISHELRAPLTLVLGPLDDLMKDAACAGIQQRLSTIQRNAHRLLRLVDSVLLLAKLQDGPPRSEPHAQVSLRPVLISMLETYQQIALREGVRVSWQQVEDVSLHCESDWPEILFANLISNAIKYTDAGGSVVVSLHGEPDGVRFVVADTGIGISPDDVGRIFEPFFRVRGERRNELLEHSSGLGLSHVKEVVERLNGHIDVKSAPGGGSTFTVFLPLAGRGVALPISQPAVAPVPSASQSTLPAPELAQAASFDVAIRPNMLIVEDNVELGQYLVTQFAGQFDCLLATDAEAAQRLTFQHLPDIVLADIRLPGRSGLDLACTLKNDVRSSHIPIVLLTALSDHELRLQGLRHQVDDYLSKPFNPEELRLRVRNLLLKREALREHFRREWLGSCGSQEVTHRASDLPTTVDNAFLQKLDAVIAAQLGDPALDMQKLCEKLHLSAKQIQRKVRSLTGFTPMEYLSNCRLRKAGEILLQGGPVSRAAYAAGFSSQSYFTTCFKQWAGETPGTWQKRRLASAAPSYSSASVREVTRGTMLGP